MPDYYEILCVQRTATQEEIRKAYLVRVRMTHPDRNKGDPIAEEATKRVIAAYEVLSDPVKRAAYDRRAGKGSDGPGAPGQDYQRAGQQYGGDQHSYSRDIPDHKFSIPLKLVEDGFSTEYERYDGRMERIHIPPGVESGERFPITYQDGSKVNLLVMVEPHENFVRKGADLYIELSIHRADAINRTVVTLETLRGTLDVPLTPETLKTKSICMKGKGLPVRHNPGRRGNLCISFKVLPTPDISVAVTLEDVDAGCSLMLKDRGIEARIPQGVDNGDRIYIPADQGREVNLLVKVLPHDRFTRRGNDLNTTVEVSDVSMMLRVAVPVNVLNRTVTIRLHPKYLDGKNMCVQGQGLPNRQNPRQRGDLYIDFVIENNTVKDQRPPSFVRKLETKALNIAGIVNEYKREILIVLIILAALAVLAGIGYVIYLIIINIKAILITIGILAVIGAIGYGIIKSQTY